MQINRTDATARDADLQLCLFRSPIPVPVIRRIDLGDVIRRAFGIPTRAERRRDAVRFAVRITQVAAAALLLLACVVALTGCTAALERAQADANASYRQTALANVNTSRVMGKAYRQLADDKHEIQAEFDQRLEADFLDSHTDENGSLVSRDPDGKIVPMRAADILQFIRDRDERRALLMQSQQSHTIAVDRYEAALTQFEVATRLMDDKNADWEKAKAEAREAHNVAIQAMLGIAAAAAAVGL